MGNKNKNLVESGFTQHCFSKMKSGAGFAIVELVVSIGIFALLAAGMLSAFSALSQAVKVARQKTILNTLATSNLEIVKNMPYSQVGTISGNPSGPLADFTNAISQTIEAITYKIYYEVTYVDDPADGSFPTDLAAGDYKQVKMSVLNTQTGQVDDFVTNIVPAGLEGTVNAGALKIQVINAIGQPVVGANIHIEYPTTTPTLILDRTSDSNGEWVEVNLPAAVNNYHIVVTKPGYTTDQTYAITASNPNPIKPDATIVEGQITFVSFAIDLVATLNIRTLNSLCQPLSGINVNVRGAKLIGTSPDVLKYDQSFSSVAGLIGLTELEWDSYTPTLLTGQSVVLTGTSPIQKIDVLPGSSQVYTMILENNSTAYSLLVIVKDASTNTPLEGANVHLIKGGSVPQDYYGITGGSVWVQSDWTGGSGQTDWSSSTPDSYFTDDANIDINSAPTGVRLNKITGRYVPSGNLESATFDTGTSATNFTTITWEPTSQSASTTLMFQIASNNDNTTWDYVGPDGTAGTYYTVSGNTISSAHNNNRYVRYKVYLATTDDKKTPVLTSVNLNYVSGCFTPGQVWFEGLTAGNNYDLDISLPGYATEIINSLNITGNQVIEVLMGP